MIQMSDMKWCSRCLFCMCALIYSWPFTVLADWPAIEPPPGARVQSVAEEMKYNGVPMRIRQFTSEGTVDNVLWFYRQKWTEGGKRKIATNTVGGWQVLGKQDGDYYITVQVRPREPRGTEGYLGVSKLPSLTESPRVDMLFPRMPGSEVISDVDSFDNGKAAKTLILKNDHSITSNQSYYESMMPGQDWKQQKSLRADQDINRRVLYFERRKEAASIVINPAPRGGTMVVINIVNTGL